MKKNQSKAFTLVELIVVITILAILGTIAFLAFQGYSKTARDSRRVSDISNIKAALELFILNTGKYPLPDNGEEVSYSGDTLWTQGTVGDNVITNLSETLKRKPLDPLLDIEYVYSATYSKKEYQVMALYEGELSKTNDLINTSYAANIYKIKMEGTYNEIFVKTDHYIVPTPSIINSEVDGSGITLNNFNIKSQVTTGGTNFLKLNIPNIIVETGSLTGIEFSATGTINKNSSDAQKISVIKAIQATYSGAISLANKSIYKNILNTTEPEILADQLILNKYNTVAGTDNYAPISIKTVADCSTTLGEIIYSTDELLTCSDDIIVCSGETGSGYTISACNVGTNVVGTGTLSFGGLYQWGNNYNFRGGQFSQLDIYPKTSSTQILTGALTSNSTYSNDTFITGTSSWVIYGPEVNNLWGDTTDTPFGTNLAARQGPCNIGYHVPTMSEWVGIVGAGNGVAWTIGDEYGMVNTLKLPLAGYRDRSDSHLDTGNHRYWSSTPSSATSNKNLSLGSGIYPNYSNSRAKGFSVRCFKN